LQQAVFKLYLQDGRDYLWQCSNKEERDVWAMSVSASVRSQGFAVQVLASSFAICTASTSWCCCVFAYMQLLASCLIYARALLEYVNNRQWYAFRGIRCSFECVLLSNQVFWKQCIVRQY